MNDRETAAVATKNEAKKTSTAPVARSSSSRKSSSGKNGASRREAASPKPARRNQARTAGHGIARPSPYLSRERSIIAFNRRVLDMALRPDVPLLERLRYLCIASSNVDEFFEVRFADYMEELARNGQHDATEAAVKVVSDDARDLVDEVYTLYNETLVPALAKAGIVILSHSVRDAGQRRWVQSYFRREVAPLLVPIGLDPAHPFPQVANKSLNFIVQLAGQDAFGREHGIAIVKVPRVLPRVIRVPGRVAAGKSAFVLLTSMIRSHLAELFPGREVVAFSQFRLTRDTDLDVDEAEVSNLREALRMGLTQRNFGNPVRLEVSMSCPDELAGFLLAQVGLPPEALFRCAGPVNLVRLGQIADLLPAPALHFPTFKPGWPAAFEHGESLFSRIAQGDVMLHHPFESFEPVIAFLREAVMDPAVLAIKQTVYRTGADSALMELLLEAARRGKEVTVVVELKARFDEEANINWAERLEALGAQVVYGVVGLKTHAKMILATRREGRRLVRYAHLSTGNYNQKTARLYTDVGYFTANEALTRDVDRVFHHIASQFRPKLSPILVMAPFHLHDRLLAHLRTAMVAARRGEPARAVIKMNALTDLGLARELVAASQAGVEIDLIVRGACILAPGIPGVTERIRVRAIVGRFLEHSRVFHFVAGQREWLYLSSADWMGRNMFRRIEVAWLVRDEALRQRILDECLALYLADTKDAWESQPDGTYVRVASRMGGNAKLMSAQEILMARYGQMVSAAR